MKIRTASSMLSAGGLLALVLLGSTLVIAQNERKKPGSALSTDPFVKRSSNAVAVAADPFAGGGGGATSPAADPFGDAGTSSQAAEDDPFGGGGGADPNDPFNSGPAAGKQRIKGVVEPVALLEYIRTDLATANELLQEFGGTEDAAPLRKRLEEMLDEGGAKLVETSYMRTLSGQRAVTESVREHIYPTEFNVPSSPQQFDGTQASMPIASACPSSFDMREVGTILQIEPVVGPGDSGERQLSIDLAPEIMRYLGDRSMAPGGTAEHKIQMMPDFAAMKLLTAVTVKEGATSLLGLLKSNPDEQQRTFVLMRADTLRSGLPKAWEPNDGSSKRLGTHLEWIQLDHRDANRLLNQGFNQRDASGMRASLKEMMEGGRAELIESAYLKSLPGQRVKNESIREHMYATEFDPPEVPKNLTIEKAEVRPVGATPTAFEVRNVGTTVELEANLDGRSQVVSINIAAEIIEYLRDRKIMEDPPEEIANVIVPDFYTMKLATNISCFLGQPNLLGVFTPHEDPGKRVLLFVKADVVR